MNYGYDSLYRLTSEAVTGDPAGKNGAINYTYDAVGNRNTLNATLPPAGVMNYSYNANDQLSTDSYDANGNTVSSAGVADSYDFENHLIQKGAVTMVYDGDGNRVTETAGGVTTTYLVDTQNPTGYAQVVDELQNGAVTKSYSYGIERISQNWQPTTGTWQPAFYGYDGHGSVRQLFDSSGTITDTYDYDAFGNLINSTGTTPNNYLFAGEQFDPALNLYYNRARYLNTNTGRFWSMDLFEGHLNDPVTLHKFLYLGANPVNQIDHCGYCAPSDATAGKAVEDDVWSQYFEYTEGLGRRSATIYNLVIPNGDQVDYAGRLLMPDFANTATKDFYELKSIYSLGAAYAKVDTYQYYLNQADPAWHPGEGFIPNLFSPIDETRFAIVFNAGPGVLSYCIISQKEVLGMAGVLLAIAGVAGVAGEADPAIEQELENPQRFPIPVPVPTGIALPSIELAGAELDLGGAVIF